LSFLSLGYEPLVADYYWLRALSHFGTREMHDVGYPNLVAFIRRVLHLDPYFTAAYVFAGTALTVKELDPSISVELLKRGAEYHPDNWRIHFLLGFNSYYFLKDYETAAKALAHAATIPGAPAQAGPLATRLAAEAGKPEVGLQMIDSIIETIHDPQLRATYEERRRRLLVELHLEIIGEGVARFERKMARKATKLSDLLTSGIMRALPQEPYGGRYLLDTDGRPKTTTPLEALRIHRPRRDH